MDAALVYFHSCPPKLVAYSLLHFGLRLE